MVSSDGVPAREVLLGGAKLAPVFQRRASYAMLAEKAGPTM